MSNSPAKQTPPLPWELLANYTVGGLFQVGYAAGSDLLLVLSSQGRGIFDCVTGKKLARDYDEAHDFFDRIHLTAAGFGPLQGATVRMAGLMGGGLPLSTHDGWGLVVEARAWPTYTFFLTAPGSRDPICLGDDGTCEFRACGFSETGQSFIFATSCELLVFARAA